MSLVKDRKRIEKEKLTEARGHLVVKCNDLIQKSRHQMDLQEQKIILYMISRIKPNDKDFSGQVFSIAEFCRVCGLDDDNGGNYAYIKKTLSNLKNRWIWVTLDDGSEKTLGWVNTITMSRRSGFVKVEFDEGMKPYLLELKGKFTQYELVYTLAMRSQYSIRLYELLKSYQYKKQVTFDIDDLKRTLFAEVYTRGNDIKIRVLEPAINEINKLTDILVTYELFKDGKRFSEVGFRITQKNIGERLSAWSEINTIFDTPTA